MKQPKALTRDLKKMPHLPMDLFLVNGCCLKMTVEAM